MGCDFERVLLSECVLAVIDNRGKTPPTNELSGHPLYEVNSVSNTSKYLLENAVRKYVDDSVYQSKFRSGHLKRGDIVVPTVGTLGQVAVASRDGQSIAQNLVAFRSDPNICDSDYLYYFLSSSKTRKQILNLDIGGVQPSIKVPHLLDMEVILPPLDLQKRISNILSIFDDAIELNNRINDYLAEIAIALFNKQCPQTKQLNAVLSNIAEITMGQSPVGSSYNEEGNGVVFYQGRAEFGSFFPRRRLFTTEPKRMAREGDTLMSVRAPVGDLNVANEDCCIGRGLAAIHSEGSQSFVHYLMRAQAKQLNSFNNNGTVFGSINGKALKELPVFLPSNDAIASLDSLLEPIDMLIRRNDDEIQALEQLRDALLPKLMSGEINVSEVELPKQLNNHLYGYL